MSGAEHYFSAAPAAASRAGTVSLTVAGRVLRLQTDTAVFSGRRLDRGTEVLLRHSPEPPPTGALLDLGAGYGPIAAALAIRSPAAEVWAVEVNARARELAAVNAAAHGLRNVRVCAPEDVPAHLRFAALYSNPPVRVGKPALHGLLTAWLERLVPAGAAYLVVHRHLGSDSLQRWLSEEGYPCQRIASHGGYRVLTVRAAP